MNYSKISKEGIKLLNLVIENDEKGITTSPDVVEDLLNKYSILSEATENVLLQNQRENEVAQELLRRTSLLIIHLNNEQKDIKKIIESNKRLIDANTTSEKKAQQDLIEIKARIAEAKKEIEKLKPKIEFQWWWIFCWWCGLAAAGIQNLINAKHAEIEKLQLNADLIESGILNKNIAEFKKTIEKLETKLKQDQAELNKLIINQKDLEEKAKLFAGKTASSSALNTEINLIKTKLQKLYDRRDRIYMLKVRLNAVLNFCDGNSYQEMPMSKILSNWGETLDDELNPSGASVHAVRLAIDGKEFGHLRKRSEFEWELIGTSKFDSYKHHAIAKILAKGSFKETLRDKWSIYLQDDSQYIAIDIWKKLLTATNKNTREVFTAEIIDGALAEKVHFYGQDHISKDAVAALCQKNNWRLATEFEVSIAWIHQGLDVFEFGQMQNNLVAVPIQKDNDTFKRGLNIMSFGSKGSGNQGFFYVENKILTFRKLKPATDTPVINAMTPASPGFVRIQNNWKQAHYIHNQNSKLEDGLIQPGWLSAHWKLIPYAGGWVNIQSGSNSNLYLNNNNGQLEVVNIATNRASALWRIVPAHSDWSRIQSNLNPDHHIHNQNGKVEIGKIDPNWTSALWKVK